MLRTSSMLVGPNDGVVLGEDDCTIGSHGQCQLTGCGSDRTGCGGDSRTDGAVNLSGVCVCVCHTGTLRLRWSRAPSYEASM